MSASSSLPAPVLRFYGDLAPWWPLISPVHEYADEADECGSVLASRASAIRTVLELGCGGGHVAYHLKRRFALTLTDVSRSMLALSQALNPECAHAEGDMRRLRLDARFDAVFVHDAIDYMTTEADLAEVMATAFVHCRPGGLAVFVPDAVTETFAPSTDCGGSDGADGRGARYLEWSYDPDPGDTLVTTEYAFLLRHADGRVESAAETHLAGLFPQQTWTELLDATGFRASVVVEQTDEDRVPRRMFVGRRPNE